MKTKDEIIGSLKKALEELDITSSLRLPIIQTIEFLQEEPEYLEEETKYCAFSTSSYTDKERKALCKGCEEECRFNKKEEPTIPDIVDEHYWEMLGEETVSEDLDSFAIKYAQDKPYPVTVCQSVKAGAKWQKQKDNNDANHALVEQIKTQQMCYEKGMADMKQQMMKDALDSTIVDDGLYKSIVPTMQAMLRYNKGDKVKIIIIKENSL